MTTHKHDAELNQAVQRALEEMRRIEAAPLSERKDARSEFSEALRDPALIVDRLVNLVNGACGRGEMALARLVLSLDGRSNKEAQLVQYLGVVEWRCPRVMGAQAWKALSTTEQKALSVAVVRVMKAAVSGVTN